MDSSATSVESKDANRDDAAKASESKTQGALDGEKLFELYRDNVVNIFATHASNGRDVMGSAGSGFFVKTADDKGPSRCEIATANHVIDLQDNLQLSKLEITLDDGSKYKAKVLSKDPAHDIAIIKLEDVKDPEKTCKALPLADKPLALGEETIRLSRTRWDTAFHMGRYVRDVQRKDLTLPDLRGEDTNRTMMLFDTHNTVGKNIFGGPYINKNGEIVAQQDAGQSSTESVATPLADLKAELEKLRKN